MTLSALKADAARCNARMVTARRTEPGTIKRGDPINATAQAILTKARGREFTASDAANWTGRDIDGLKYTLDAMLKAGLIRCRTVVLGARIFQEVR